MGTSDKTQKVKNWGEYNEASVDRGRLTVWISEEAIENLFGGWIRSRDIAGEVQNGAQATPVVGAERERGHAPGELPGECRTRSALGV